MPKSSHVKLLKRIRNNGNWMRVPALFDSEGQVRRDHVHVTGRDEVHPERSYFIEWWEEGRRVKEAAGPDAFIAAEKMRNKQAMLSAIRSGIIAPPDPKPDTPERKKSPPPSTNTATTSAITAPCAPSELIGRF